MNRHRPKAVFFGMEEDPDCFLRAIRSGARGYLLKEASSEEIVSAVCRVAEGEAICPPRLCMWLFEYVASQRKALRDDSEKTNGAMRQLNADSRHEAAVLIHAEDSVGPLN